MGHSKHLPHPGEILKHEFLDEFGLSNYMLSKKTGISESSIGKIIRGKIRITAKTAIQLGAFFGNSPQFWLNLQSGYELRKTESTQGEALRQNIEPLIA